MIPRQVGIGQIDGTNTTCIGFIHYTHLDIKYALPTSPSLSPSSLFPLSPPNRRVMPCHAMPCRALILQFRLTFRDNYYPGQAWSAKAFFVYRKQNRLLFHTLLSRSGGKSSRLVSPPFLSGGKEESLKETEAVSKGTKGRLLW